MSGELALAPSGRIVVRELLADAGSVLVRDAHVDRFLSEFATSQSAGLIRLAGHGLGSALPPSLDFWRDFAALYLTALCQFPDVLGERPIDPITPPSPAKRAELLLGVPPMPGAEYLSSDVIEAIWRELDEWARGELTKLRGGVAAFLEHYAPAWRQVGRVCFHLAENKRDPDAPFAFLATYIPGMARGSSVRHQPLGQALQEYAGEKNKQALVRLLSPVHRASECSKLVRELVDSGDLFHPLAWTPREAYRSTDIPLFESSGLLVRIPDWWHKRPRPQVQVRIGDSRQPTLGADSLLDFDVSLALGDQSLSEREWRQLLSGEDGLVLLKGRWVEINREKLEAALDHWRKVEQASGSGVSFVEGMRLLAGASPDLGSGGVQSEDVSEWSYVRAGEWLGDVLDQLRTPTASVSLRLKDKLHATLRPYQQVGVDWLWLLTNLGLGACLADDMGLGKTIQVLALLLLLRDPARPPSLLVLPASLLANWKSEISRFAPSLRFLMAHPSETERDALSDLAERPDRVLAGLDVVLTTYAMLQRQKWIGELEWQLVILDEAQAIKNPSAAQSKAVKQLRARARIALTGTPVENRLSDLWSLFDFLCPGLLGSASRFKQFVKDMQRGEHARYGPLRNLVRPYILRRLKTDRTVIQDLPEKIEVTAYCGLSKRQAALYEKSVAEMRKMLEAVEGIQRRGMVLSYLMRFKQICNHPSQWLGSGDYERGESGKFERLVELAEELASRQDKLLVFTQFREMTEPLQALLAEVFGRPGLVLHGGTPVKQRQKLVDRFQADAGPPFFVLSLKAGGTGLNLTAASHVIHFDRWWNPAVENQATDRAFRIGQKRNVLVQKFVCRGTIEERIDRLIEDKKSLAADLLAGGADAILTEMSNAELLDLVALDVNHALL